MLLITQQLVDEEQNTWQDVAVPHDVHTIEDWQVRLERHGIGGTFKAVGHCDEHREGEPIVKQVFKVVPITTHNVQKIEETTVEDIDSE